MHCLPTSLLAHLSAKAEVPSEAVSSTPLYFFDAFVSLDARSLSFSRLPSSSPTLLRNKGLSCRSLNSRLPTAAGPGCCCPCWTEEAMLAERQLLLKQWVAVSACEAAAASQCLHQQQARSLRGGAARAAAGAAGPGRQWTGGHC